MKNLWTKRNIMDYLSHPEESLDKNYTPIRQMYRKWKSAEAIAAQRLAMIAHIDDVRGFMEELSPELRVTDPISGNIVSKVGYLD